MITALVGSCVLRASKDLKDKKFTYRCRDPKCEHPELELVVGRGLRIPYFRHRTKGKCSCPEGETDWHLEWKSHFERVEEDMGVDPVTGEHNRADAVVGDNFVIEFQHSAIKEEEQLARERFYSSKGGMVWVADASGVRARAHFERGKNVNMTSFKDAVFRNGYYYIRSVEDVFPKQWYNRSVGVVFDFGENENLFYLLPGRQSRGSIPEVRVGRFYTRMELVEALKTNSKTFSKSPVKLREEYQWELDRPKRERKERLRLKELGQQLFNQFGQRAVDKARRRQQGKPMSVAALEPIILSYCADALGRVYRFTENRRSVVASFPSDDEFRLLAKQYEAEQAKRSGNIRGDTAWASSDTSRKPRRGK